MTQSSLGSRPGLTLRSLALALLAIVVIEFAAFRVEIVRSAESGFTSGAPAAAPHIVLLLLALANLLPARLRLGLSRRETLVVFIIVAVCTPLVSHGSLSYLLPHAIYLQYARAVRPEWEGSFVSLFPTWFSPTARTVARGFFEGSSSVPWSAWALPAAAWSSFLLALVSASCSLSVLIQRQWITHERLSFPLTQIPLAMVDSRQGVGRPTLSSAFWIGFGLSAAITGWNRLALLYPSLPGLPIGPVPLVSAQPVGLTAALGQIDLVLWPWLIAIAYLVPTEVSLSCWLFWGLHLARNVVVASTGIPVQGPYGLDETNRLFGFQGLGALLALFGWMLWRARHHLGHALRLALGRRPDEAERDDPVPYRAALLVLLLSYAWMVGFCMLVGSRFVVALGVIGLLLVQYLMWGWLRAEAGLNLAHFPVGIEDMLSALGSTRLRPRELVAILSLRWAFFAAGSSPQVVSGNLLDGMKLRTAAETRLRPLLLAAAGAFLVALGVGVYVVLTGYHAVGFQNVRAAYGGWLGTQVEWGTESIHYHLTDPSKFDLGAVLGVFIGGAIALGLGLLRLRFAWWPLSPLGFLASGSWGMHWYYLPFFVGWLLKVLAMRYGGLRLYRSTLPAAAGLLAGDLLMRAAWGLFGPGAGP